MWVLLANSDEDNRFARGVDHIDGSSNFLVHSVKLGQDDPVNGPRIGHIDGEVDQRLVELRELVDRIVAH